MSVQQMAARVVEVLARAESLFSTPGDSAAPEAAGRTDDAAHASAAISTSTAELSGVLASAHRDLLAETTHRLEDAAATDARLGDSVSDTSTAHSAARSQATDLRAGAAEIPTVLGPWAELPAAELAALKALRNRVAGMQRLLADHSAEAARVGGEIRSLGYRI
jgi:hypothetical protein